MIKRNRKQPALLYWFDEAQNEITVQRITRKFDVRANYLAKRKSFVPVFFKRNEEELTELYKLGQHWNIVDISDFDAIKEIHYALTSTGIFKRFWIEINRLSDQVSKWDFLIAAALAGVVIIVMELIKANA